MGAMALILPRLYTIYPSLGPPYHKILRPPLMLIGSLSNNDGDGYENLTLKKLIRAALKFIAVYPSDANLTFERRSNRQIRQIFWR